MGALDLISNFCNETSTTPSTRRTKRKPMQTVEIKVKMDCDGCERRVKNAVSTMKDTGNATDYSVSIKVEVTANFINSLMSKYVVNILFFKRY
ncbi:Heavy metal-associated isoprenylated plant protein 22 [Linum grandiflorum]